MKKHKRTRYALDREVIRNLSMDELRAPAGGQAKSSGYTGVTACDTSVAIDGCAPPTQACSQASQCGTQCPTVCPM